MSWGLPERVKRLSLPGYRYQAEHFGVLSVCLAEVSSGEAVAVVAYGEAPEADALAAHKTLLLHGLYVDPVSHREGVGTALVEHATEVAAREGYGGILVKAQPGAVAFFETLGFARLPVEDPETDFKNRYWKAV